MLWKFSHINGVRVYVLLFVCRIVEKYHGFLAFVLFVQIVQSVIVFSMTLIILLTTNKGPVYFANKLIYLIALLYEMAVLCYLGNEIYFSVNFSFYFFD